MGIKDKLEELTRKVNYCKIERRTNCRAKKQLSSVMFSMFKIMGIETARGYHGDYYGRVEDGGEFEKLTIEKLKPTLITVADIIGLSGFEVTDEVVKHIRKQSMRRSPVLET
jgi:hypothetical protein